MSYQQITARTSLYQNIENCKLYWYDRLFSLWTSCVFLLWLPFQSSVALCLACEYSTTSLSPKYETDCCRNLSYASVLLLENCQSIFLCAKYWHSVVPVFCISLQLFRTFSHLYCHIATPNLMLSDSRKKQIRNLSLSIIVSQLEVSRILYEPIMLTEFAL